MVQTDGDNGIACSSSNPPDLMRKYSSFVPLWFACPDSMRDGGGGDDTNGGDGNASDESALLRIVEDNRSRASRSTLDWKDFLLYRKTANELGVWEIIMLAYISLK